MRSINYSEGRIVPTIKGKAVLNGRRITRDQAAEWLRNNRKRIYGGMHCEGNRALGYGAFLGSGWELVVWRVVVY